MKNTKVLLSIALALLLSCTAFSQAPVWVNYTLDKDIRVTAVEANYTWTGSRYGLTRLDQKTGEQIVYDKSNSGLPDNSIH